MGLQLLNLSDLRPSLPGISRLSGIDLPDLPNLNALSNLAGQLQAVISGAIAHPFWAIAIVVLSITLIQIIADLIKRSLKALLSLLLRLPLFISQWIWRRATSQKKAPTDAQILSKAEQADQLIVRLEALRQEQDTVILALKDLLNQPELRQPELRQPELRQPESQPVLPPDVASPSLPTPEPLSESQPHLP